MTQPPCHPEAPHNPEALRLELAPGRLVPPALDVDALRLELARLRAAIALLATRMPAAALSDADGRILVDLLTPPPDVR